MDRPDWKGALGEAFEQAVTYLDGLPDRPIRPEADLAQLRDALGGPLPDAPQQAARVVAELAAAAGPGVIASGSVRRRRCDARGAGRRLAGLRVGPERGAVRARARRGRRRGGRRGLGG